MHIHVAIARWHDGTWSEQPVYAQVYTCRSQSAGMYRSFPPNESSLCRCPSGSRRWIFTGVRRSHDIVLLCQDAPVQLSSQIQLYYAPLLRMHFSGSFHLKYFRRFYFLFSLDICYFFSIRYLVKCMEVVSSSKARAFDFLRSFTLLFRAVSIHLMI